MYADIGSYARSGKINAIINISWYNLEEANKILQKRVKVIVKFLNEYIWR